MIQRILCRNSLVRIILRHSLKEIDRIVVAVDSMRQHLSFPLWETFFVVGHLIYVFPHSLIGRSKLAEYSVQLVDLAVSLEHRTQHHLMMLV